MGLFNRNERESTPEDDDLELPTQEDFHEPLVEDSKLRSQSRYSIDDAIALMRDLPDEPDERLMEVVCKTLESARIRTDDVLKDAQHKEQRIRRDHEGIEQDIARLQKQIDDKQAKLAELSTSLEELTRIKGRFEKVRATQPQAEAKEKVDTPESSPMITETRSDNLETDELSSPIVAGRRGRGNLPS